MYRIHALFFFLVILTSMAIAQHPFRHHVDAIEIRFDRKQPVVNYILSVDSGDLSFFSIEMRLRNIPDTFHVAMFAHPEYDDKYWRYVEEMRVDAKNSRAIITREDSALWRIIAPGGEAVLHYRLHLPKAEGQRASWQPFLSGTGGLVGGPHSFMYVVGATLASSRVSLQLPRGWQAITGLELTSDPFSFFAPSVRVLIDAPILIGNLKSWSFMVDGIPHRVAYWPLPHALSFDSMKFVSDIQRIVQQASALFGRLPYREYSFLLQDGAFGSLEHSNSVTVGAPSDQLSKDMTGYLSEIAHEYIHTWNLVRIHPEEYGDVTYKTPPYSRSLWWSEGLTMFYADLLLRLAHLPTRDSTRLTHLEGLIRRYFSNSGNYKVSAEEVSLAEYAPPGALGDHIGSAHLQGELLGVMFDLIIRDATNGKYSIDDAMRIMLERFSGVRGFTGKDVEQVITKVCGCNVHSIFEDHVRGSKSVDFNKYLPLIGLHYDSSLKDVVDPAGKPLPDLRIFASLEPGKSMVKLVIFEPSNCWGKSGLHTGDQIISVNGTSIKTVAEFRRSIRVQPGDILSIDVQRPTGIFHAKVIVSGYQQPVVHVTEIPQATGKQRKLLMQWKSY